VSVALNTSSRQRRRDDQRGTALVEFAICVTLLCTLLFGIISYGYALSFKQGLTQAAAEGARAAAVVTNVSAPNVAAGAVGAALNAFSKNCSSPGMSCTYLTTTAATGCPVNTCIRVQISYDYKNYPLMPKFLGLGLLLPDTIKSTSIVQTS
jgi:Flp pilus assembly protein TadG